MNHDNVIFATTHHGGHLGFFEGGLWYPDTITWLDKIVVQYANAIVETLGKNEEHRINSKQVTKEIPVPKPMITVNDWSNSIKTNSTPSMTDDLRKRNINKNSTDREGKINQISNDTWYGNKSADGTPNDDWLNLDPVQSSSGEPGKGSVNECDDIYRYANGKDSNTSVTSDYKAGETNASLGIKLEVRMSHSQES